MNQRPSNRDKMFGAPPLLQRAGQLRQLGKLDQAERLYKAIVATQPANLEALHLLGSLQFQRGRHDDAISTLSAASRVAPGHARIWSDIAVLHATAGRAEEAVTCYDRAIALEPDNAAAHSNRGAALGALKRSADALASYDRALAIEPCHLAALNNRGGLLREMGRPAEALASLDRALAIKPDSAEALNNRGSALNELGRAEEALDSFERALALNPGSANTLNNRGNALLKLGRPAEALASYETALALNPQNAEAWSNRGNALTELKRYDEAVECLRRALSLTPNHANAFNNLGNALLAQKRLENALANYDSALVLKPDFVEALANRATALIGLNRPAEALGSSDRAIALRPDYIGAHNNRGAALSLLGREEDALASYDRALALKPDDVAALDNKGVALLQLGRVEEAAAAHEAAIRLAPKRARSYHHFALSRRVAPGDPRLKAMEDLVCESSSLDAEDQTYAHFALAKAYADVGDCARSFRHMADGNALKRKQCGYNEPEVLGAMARTQAAYMGELMGRNAGCGDPSPAPIFVVGMPRSGTTLVEQILASHPDIHGAGEIKDFEMAAAELGGLTAQALLVPEVVSQMSGEQFRHLGANYLRRVLAAAPTASRIVNKMTENFRFAGLIALALPNARIIHVRRDPVDNCFSCYATLFVESLPYAYDLVELGCYYRAYETLMDFWRAVLPQGVMIDVRYEDVVADLEGQGRRLVDHCGLDWDAHCLDFHRTERSVRTASLVQVRQPLYKTSVGRWRPYEAFLGPLRAALGEGISPAGGR